MQRVTQADKNKGNVFQCILLVILILISQNRKIKGPTRFTTP